MHNILISLDTKGNIKIERKLRAKNNIPSIKPKTLFYKKEYSSGNGIKVIKSLFNNQKVFAYSKPLELIKDFINIGTSDNDIILDFFAGSGTTAQAILDINKEENKNLKFILIEQMDYIKNITCKRIEKVIDKNEQGSFVYAELKTIDDFKDKKIKALDKNMAYLPIGDIEDEDYNISKEEIAINKAFYGLKK